MQGKKNLFSVDMLILVIIAAACVYMFCAAMGLSGEAKLFPQIISAVTFVFTLYGIGKNVKMPVAQASEAGEEKRPARQWNHLLLVAVGLLYVALLEPIGFIICTVALFIAIPLILGNRKYVTILLIAVIATAVFYLIFKKGFYVSLPSGILPFL